MCCRLCNVQTVGANPFAADVIFWRIEILCSAFVAHILWAQKIWVFNSRNMPAAACSADCIIHTGRRIHNQNNISREILRACFGICFAGYIQCDRVCTVSIGCDCLCRSNAGCRKRGSSVTIHGLGSGSQRRHGQHTHDHEQDKQYAQNSLLHQNSSISQQKLRTRLRVR